MNRLLLIAAVTNPLTWVAAVVALLALSLLAVAALGLLVAWCWWAWTVGSHPTRRTPSLTLGVPPAPPASAEPAPAEGDVVAAELPPADRFRVDPKTIAPTAEVAPADEFEPTPADESEPVAAVGVTPARKPAKAKTVTMMDRRRPTPPPARKPGRATLRAEAARLGVPKITRGMRAESIARKIAEFRAA